MVHFTPRLLARVIPPATEPVTLDEAKLFLRVDNDMEDDLISDLIIVARESAEEFMRRSLITQTWKLAFDDCIAAETVLPRGPVQSVVSLTTYTIQEASTSISSDNYRLNAARDRLVLDAGLMAHRVEITYVTGYEDADDVPKPIKLGLLNHVAALYDKRGEAMLSLPPDAMRLFSPYRLLEV